jgi:pSer/pThr/pTyr-binding forkhead associated (FHA) protein
MSKQVLALLRGGSVVATFSLQAGQNLFGRGLVQFQEGNFIDLEEYDLDLKVSQKHALVNCLDAATEIEDCGSLNGTFLNRTEQLEPGVKYQLKSGDKVLIGKLLFEYQVV